MTVRSTRAAIPPPAPPPQASETPPGQGSSPEPTSGVPGADSATQGTNQGPDLTPPEGWFAGPWAVLTGVDSLEVKPRLSPGEVMRHKSGNVVLTCPACHALQFGTAKITGTDERPSLDRPLHCGSGHCRRCGVWFTLRDGVALLVAAPAAPAGAPVPERLARAGVHTPPRQPA
jgi:hypothetical protein